jgi:putative peptide modification target (TIGR04139 family)
MKKLKGMKNFSSLENKKLNDLKSISGGIEEATKDKITVSTGGGKDGKTYIDGKLVYTSQF